MLELEQTAFGLQPDMQMTINIHIQGWVARGNVSGNRWLSCVKTYKLSWYLIWVSANHASSNTAQNVTSNDFGFQKSLTS